jgi:sialic acid synthase SpsE
VGYWLEVQRVNYRYIRIQIMKGKIQIDQNWVGPGEPVFVTVETGTTCNGDLGTALDMIDASAEAGADAIKFMIIDPDYFMSDKTVAYEYSTTSGAGKENMYEMFKGLKFSIDDWRRIRERCEEKGIIFYATVDYVPGVQLAEELGVSAYKLSSWDARNYPLIQRMAATGKPVVVDLGPTYVQDIAQILDVMEGEANDQAVLVHCTHAKTDEEMNIRSVPHIFEVFRCPTGYSADSRDMVPDLGAISLGAHFIEKRLTMDKDFHGHHHDKALEPDELKEWVATVRRMEAMLGEAAIIPSSEDLRQRELYFVSLVANADIPGGTVITEDMVACKRPGSGIDPGLLEVFVGRTAVCDIKENQLLSWDLI